MVKLALALATAVWLIVAADAGACSCAQIDPRKALAGADAAVIGTVARTEVSGDRIHTVVAVEQGFKAELGTEVVVDTGSLSSIGGGCGVRFEAGRRVGLFLYREGEAWTSSLCSQVDPPALQRAALAPPAALGRGRVALVAAMRSDAGRLAGLDARGRVVVYGSGTGRAVDVAACPGGRRLAELAETTDGPELAIRALPGLRLVRRVPLDLRHPRAVACADRAARTALVSDSAGSADDRILRVRGKRVSELFRGSGVNELLSARGRVFAVTGVDLRRIDPATGRAPTVATLRGGGQRAFTIAPGGGAVGAVESGDGDWTAQVLRPGGPTRTAALPRHTLGSLTWLNRDRVLLGGVATPFRLFDRRLRELRVLPAGFGPRVQHVAGRAGTAYAVDGDQLVAASLPDLAIRTLARLPTSDVFALEPIRGAKRLAAAAASTCPR